MISLYVVRKRLMSRMGSMLTIPSPPFGSSWHSLASPYSHSTPTGSGTRGGSSKRIQITLGCRHLHSPSPAVCPALSSAPRSALVNRV